MGQTHWCQGPSCHGVEGGWGLWGAWSQCDKACGRGSSIRQRACDHPVPSNGGRDCVGLATQRKGCQEKLCAVDGGWGPWTSYGACSKSCGHGIKSGTRECNNPKPRLGGANCEGPTSRSQGCNLDPCPEPEPEPEPSVEPESEVEPYCPQVICRGTDGVRYPTPCHVPLGVSCYRDCPQISGPYIGAHQGTN